MSAPRVVSHRHIPLYRVIRRNWSDPLDAAYSQTRADNRWNTAGFRALYCCCSLPVARVVAQEMLRRAGIVLADMRPEVRPALAEIRWSGRVVDMASSEGIAAAGFGPRYPVAIAIAETQERAAAWYSAGLQGVVCRSASMARVGYSAWQGDHRRWGELAIFAQNARRKPALLVRREGLDWLT